MEFDMNKEKITIEKNGKTVECDVLFTFDSEDTMRSYVGYTNHSVASNGRKNIFVSAFNPFLKNAKLEDVKDPRELEMVQEVLEGIAEGKYE